MNRLRSSRSGIALGVAAYASWGIVPLYLKALAPLPAPAILALRILWSLVFLTLLAAVLRSGTIMRVARQPRLIAALAASALLIASNWLIYIYAVNSHHIVQASLGYFINPLINVLLGLVVLRERLGRAEIVAVMLAVAGVASLAIWQQALPILSIALALSFALYGLVRRLIPVEALDGLVIETVLLSPLALAWLLTHDGFTLPAGGPSWGIVALSGIVTGLPLLMFNAATRRVRFAALGLLQYISPTLQLAVAVFAFGEPLLPIHLLSFGLIWAGLVIYGTSNWRRGRAVPPMSPE